MNVDANLKPGLISIIGYRILGRPHQGSFNEIEVGTTTILGGELNG
jgi:hypothetical protein